MGAPINIRVGQSTDNTAAKLVLMRAAPALRDALSILAFVTRSMDNANQQTRPTDAQVDAALSIADAALAAAEGGAT